MVTVPGIAGVPEGGTAGQRPLSQLRTVGLAHDDGAGGAQASHQLGVARRGREVARAPERGRLAGHVDVVFHGDRDPEQRQALTGGDPAVGLGGFGQ